MIIKIRNFSFYIKNINEYNYLILKHYPLCFFISKPIYKYFYCFLNV